MLVLDNYDSFTYNLAQRLGTLGAEVEVVRNDHVTVAELVARAEAGDFTHLVVSPGPGRPEDAGISVAAVAALGGLVPVLGVCLGHQCIGQAYGASVVRSGRPVHGRRSLVHHDGRGCVRRSRRAVRRWALPLAGRHRPARRPGRRRRTPATGC